jgi:hypothetical protein
LKIFTWIDNRVNAYNVYAQRIDSYGQLGMPEVSVPAAVPPMLSIEGVQPNPAPFGSMVVTFTLASGASARIDLLDLAGRRVGMHDVSSFAVGYHSLKISPLCASNILGHCSGRPRPNRT